MPVYEEKVKDKITGKMIVKKVGKDKQKQYYIRTYITDENGNKKQVTKHNKEWIGKDGYWKAHEEENLIRNKKYNNYENITINQLYEMYLNSVINKLKPSTIRKLKDNYRLHIKPFLGNKKVFSLTTQDILEFHSKLDEKKNKIKTSDSKRGVDEYKLSTKFKKNIHINLVSMLNYACKYLELSKNVASIVGNFKAPKGTIKKEMQFLTIEEFNEFILQEKNEIYKDFYTILFYTGMRKGELLALTKEDIYFEKNELVINKSLNPRNGIKSTVPKTNKSNRTIKMLGVVSEILKKYKDSDNTCIFGLDKIKLTTLQRKCDNNCKSACIDKNIRIHDFRHSFASMCINKGVPIEIISEYLGHENISTTLNTYSHLYPNSQDKLISILEK